MKKFVILSVLIAGIVLAGCQQSNAQATGALKSPATGGNPAESTVLYESADKYTGEYLDSDINEPNLEIAVRADGKYTVQIGIYRLTALSDGVGTLTENGIEFTATDAAGNPISGIITVEDGAATVKFTDSTWEHIQNGSTFLYTKSSDKPNLWN